MDGESPYGFKLQSQERISFNNFPPRTDDCFKALRIVIRDLHDASYLAGHQIKAQPVFVQTQTNISESRSEGPKLEDWLEANTHNVTLR